MAVNGKSKLTISPALQALVERFVSGEQFPVWVQTPNVLLDGKTPEMVFGKKGDEK